jgi:hypothetical protein
MGKLGGRRRRGVRSLFECDRATMVRSRRPNDDQRLVDLPSGHRQPENNAWLTRHNSSGAEGRPCHDPSRAPAFVRQVDPGFRLRLPQGPARRTIESGKRSSRSTTRPGAVRAA